MKKSILIIGSSGYFGSKLSVELKKKYKLFTPSKKKLDITNIKHIKRYSKKNLNYIINLSGQISSNSKNMKNNILNGNRNLIEIFKKKKTKIFFFSTSLVYGYSNLKKRETSITKPLEKYSSLKLLAEKEFLNSNTNFKILRLCNIYNGKNTGFIKNLSESLIKKKRIFLTNTDVYRNYIHIDDCVKIVSKMLSTNLKYNIYNIGNENIKLINILKYIEKRFNLKINYINRNISIKKIPSQKICSNRILKEIKYKPKIKIYKYLLKKFNDKL